MDLQWIVVSDAAQARIFSRHAAASALKPVDTLTHSQSRLHEGDLRTGGKGETHESTGSSVHQPDPQTTTGEKHADIFAKEVAQALKRGRIDNAYNDLVLVADPSFLGRLRDHLDNPTRAYVTQTIDKNWAQHDAREIGRLLADKLDR